MKDIDPLVELSERLKIQAEKLCELGLAHRDHDGDIILHPVLINRGFYLGCGLDSPGYVPPEIFRLAVTINHFHGGSVYNDIHDNQLRYSEG